ncbi:hypothetical protein CITRIK5_70395 [Citricoccus sp. K5]|nr:hypothetical protein CITRIK5_70395 [Citricoccus sp. K5]
MVGYSVKLHSPVVTRAPDLYPRRSYPLPVNNSVDSR